MFIICWNCVICFLNVPLYNYNIQIATFGITAQTLGHTLCIWSCTNAAWHIILARVGIVVFESANSRLRRLRWKAAFTLRAAKVGPETPVICHVCRGNAVVVVVVVVRVEESKEAVGTKRFAVLSDVIPWHLRPATGCALKDRNFVYLEFHSIG